MPGTSLVQRQLLGNGCEEIADVFSRLGRGFEEEKAGLVGVGFGIGSRDGALVGLFGNKIKLVTREGNDYVLVGLALQLFDPGLGLVERRLEGHVSMTSGARRAVAVRRRTDCVMS